MKADGITLSERDRAIIRRVLAPYGNRIERVGVFGSRALGTATPASDIDLVLWGDVDDALAARLWTLFDESSLAVTVDLVVHSPALAPTIKRHLDLVAKPLFSKTDLLVAKADPI